jgi:hypothetical protein
MKTHYNIITGQIVKKATETRWVTVRRGKKLHRTRKTSLKSYFGVSVAHRILKGLGSLLKT